ncbi:MAG: DMT family transporter [Candidatus Parcubacteria bacterium]|nr:DMT family transporter [Candidatus Parcubacteria bacterium]
MKKTNKGLYLVLGTALISGVSVFLNKFAVQAISNSDVFTTSKNLLVGIILTALVLTPFLFNKIRNVARADWLKLGLIGIIGGSAPFLLFFKGLSLTSASSAAFIHKTLFIWVSLLAIYFLREKIGKLQYLALALLFFGNFVMLGFKFFNYGYGEFLVLVATLMWAIEFVIAKKVLRNIDSEIVAWARMFFGSIILLAYLAATSQIQNLITLNSNQWVWVAISSVLLLGYVLTWYKALKYLPAVTVTSILVLASPITTCLEIINTHKFNIYQIGGSLLITLACVLIIYSVRKINDVQVTSPKFN